MLRHAREGLLWCLLGVVRFVGSSAQMVTIVSSNATRWDERNSSLNGCGSGADSGCVPGYTHDDLLNNVYNSRWSCHAENMPSQGPCIIDFDLGAIFALTHTRIYFHKSNDTDRHNNTFSLGVSATGTSFTTVYTGQNTIPTPLGTGNNFSLGSATSGRYMRMTGLDADENWLSVSEVQVFTSDPSPSVTPAPVVTLPPTLTTVAPTSGPLPATQAPTSVGCDTLEISGAGQLSGDYTLNVGIAGTTYVASGSVGATLSYTDEAEATCSSSLGTDCAASQWTLVPDDTDTYATYEVSDDATHPALITEVWFRIPAGCSGSSVGACAGSPADLEIVCSDGSVTAAPTPSPADESNCDVVEVVGTQGGEWDSFYSVQGDAFEGYDVGADGVATTNGNELYTLTVSGACSTGPSTSSSSDCAYKQWWVSGPDQSSDTRYFTFDEAAHPADIATGSSWYTSSDDIRAYDGDVNITCAPAATPTLAPSSGSAPTLSPSSSGVGSEGVETTTGDDGDRQTAIIAGSVGGGIVLLLIIAGVAAYKMRTAVPQQQPPSYDDIVGAK